MKYLYYLLTVLIFSTFSACGAHARYDLGIPAAKSESFYFHMKEAALESGYDVTVSEKDGSMSVYTPEGQLNYRENGDGMEVALHTKDREDEAEEKELLLKLEDIHEELLAKAKKLAESNKTWN